MAILEYFVTSDFGTSVKKFNAKGNGTSDDSSAIQSAIDYVSSLGGGTVFFPIGTYLVRNNIVLRNKVNLLGIKGKSEIKFDDTFVGKKNNPNPSYPAIMWNEHNNNTYDSTTADSFSIESLKFTKYNNTAKSNTILFFRNTNNVTIDSCQFDMSGNVSSLAIYAYSCNYNMTISNNSITNLTGNDIGGGIWICNVTNTPSETNKTYNVNVINNNFVTNSGDETLSIYGRDGLVKRVSIVNNKFYTVYNAAQAQSKVLTLMGRTSPTGNAGAGVEDAIVSKNIFEVEEIGAGVIIVGSSNSSTDIIKNILIDSNIIRFKTQISSSYATGILAYTVGTAENIKVSNNIIKNTGTVPCKYGIYSMWDVENNEVSGLYYQANISNCNNVISNYLYDNVVGSAIKNATFVCNNVIKNCQKGIMNNTGGTYNILNNKIDLPNDSTSMGIFITTTPSVDILNGNIINTINPDSVAFKFTMGSITMINNFKYGTGKYLDGTVVLLYANGNRIDDKGFDTFYPGFISDNEIQDALPIGHITWNNTADGTAIGWRKIALGNGASKWQAINS